MLGTASAVLLIIAALFLMKFRVGFDKGKLVYWLLERGAAFLFVSAGTLSLTGWLGDLTTYLVNLIVGFANTASVAIVGTSAAVGLIVVGISIYWILCFLPKKLYRKDMNDALIYGGFFLPVLLAAATIPLAGPLLAIFEGIGSIGVDIVTRG